nr:immunoglobulin light chain junction region [Macaca mulatta]
CHQSNTFPFSF